MLGAFQYFSEIDDPSSPRNQRHPLMMLVGTTLLASLSGIDSFSGFADFTEAHYEKLMDYFDFPYGIPSHDIYQRLWDAINPGQFYASFMLFTQSLSKLSQTFINLDGKTIRNSGDERALHIVSAWCHTNQLVLAQEKVESKSNEITALPKLIELLDLKGRIVTMDAMGAKETFAQRLLSKEEIMLFLLRAIRGDFIKMLLIIFLTQNSFLNANLLKKMTKVMGELNSASPIHLLILTGCRHSMLGLA